MAEPAGGPGAPRSARRGEVVHEARRLLEEEGPDALTMRRLAERLGMQAPSLYKHVASKGELEAAIVASAFEEQADTFERALAAAGAPAGPKALRALAAAYREHALVSPHLYRLVNARPLDRSALPAGLEARAAAPLVAAAGGDGTRARAAWAFAHGMVMLELDRRFPEGADLDAAWAAGVEALAPPAPPVAPPSRKRGGARRSP